MEKKVIEGIPDLLEDGRKADQQLQAYKQQIQELYAEIGELTTKLNWLKKKSGIKLD